MDGIVFCKNCCRELHYVEMESNTTHEECPFCGKYNKVIANVYSNRITRFEYKQDDDFMAYMYRRLVNLHGEDIESSHMIRFRKIIDGEK